jgi:hypothetical protein
MLSALIAKSRMQNSSYSLINTRNDKGIPGVLGVWRYGWHPRRMALQTIFSNKVPRMVRSQRHLYNSIVLYFRRGQIDRAHGTGQIDRARVSPIGM